MSFEGQVLCQRMLIGPWALTTLGAASVPAPAAPAASALALRNFRRESGWTFLPMGSPPESYVQGAFSIAGSGIPRPDRREIRFHTKVAMARRRRVDPELDGQPTLPVLGAPWCDIKGWRFLNREPGLPAVQAQLHRHAGAPNTVLGALARVNDTEQKS